MKKKQLVYLKDVSTLHFQEDKCVGCGMCLEVCPQRVFVRQNGKVQIRSRDYCMECGACAMNCPQNAISVRRGVGCAQAIINNFLGRNQASCCTLAKEDDSSGKSRISCC